jgi:hypothetical protein
MSGSIMKLMLYMILMMASAISIVAGEDYRHKYDTFEIGFSTPHQIAADVQWGTEKVGMKILVNLSTGERPFVFRHTLTTWDSRSSTNANLEKLWATYADGHRYYTPTISKLDNGDFLVTGRMIVMDSMFTRAMRTFDFDQDEKLDYIVVWNGNGKFDYDLLNHLASTTYVSQIQTKASRSASHSYRPKREPYQGRSWSQSRRLG